MISAFLKFRKQNRKKLHSRGYIKKLHNHSYIGHEEVHFFLCISLLFKKFIFVEVTLIYNIMYVSHVQRYISTLYTLQLLSKIYFLHLHTVDLFPHFTFISPSPLCHVYFCLVCSFIAVFISLFFILHK